MKPKQAACFKRLTKFDFSVFDHEIRSAWLIIDVSRLIQKFEEFLGID